MNQLLPTTKSEYDIEVQIDSGIKTFTNGDDIKGQVILTVSPDEDIPVHSILIALRGELITMLEDTSLTPRFDGNGESHVFLDERSQVFPTKELSSPTPSKTSFTFPSGVHVYPFSFTLPSDDFNLQCIEEGGFLHKRGYIKDELINPPVTLPPSLVFEVGASNYARIDYSISVVIQKSASSKGSVELKKIFTFLPKLNFVTFNPNKIQGANSKLKRFEFKYELEQSKSGIIGLLKKALPRNRVAAGFELQATFLPHLEPYNSIYNSPRILETGDNLSNTLRLALLTDLSYEDLLRKIGPENSSESEKLILTHLKIKLVSSLNYKSQIFTNGRTFRSTLFNKKLNYAIDHRDFVQVSSSEKNDLASFTLGAPDSLNIYRFDLPETLYAATINALLPSFITCSIQMTHRLHITATFSSSINPKLSSRIKLRPDVVLLKDFFKSTGRDDESLPVYTAMEDSSDDE